MAERRRIYLELEGLRDDDHHVKLPVLLDELQHLGSLLSKLDSRVGKGERYSDFRVVSLSHSSPAEIGIEGAPRSGKPDTSDVVMSHLTDSISSIVGGIVPDDLDYDVLVDLQALAKPVGKRIERVVFKEGSSSYTLDTTFSATIDRALEESETCYTSIEGTLEQINVHDDANVFRIYPPVGPKRIICHFTPNQYDEATGAVGKQVLVSGLAKYRPNSWFPHEMEVGGIEIYPEDEDLPTFEDIRGIAPDATGELASEEFIERVREAWGG